MTDSIEALLLQVLAPLYRKVRRASVTRFARLTAPSSRQLAALEPAAVPGLVHDALVQLQAEIARVEEQLAGLQRAWASASTETQRRAVLEAHLEATVSNPIERHRDRRALRRWMSVDALRERLERERHRLLVDEETGLLCLRGVLDIPAPGETGEPVQLASIAIAILRRARQVTRPQNQLAALEALAAVVRHGGALPAVAAQARLALVELADQPGLDPFVQAAAVRALLCVARPDALALLQRRFAGPFPGAKDFLFRRQLVDSVAPMLDGLERQGLLLAARRDPSEYVRMGLCALLGAATHPDDEVLRGLTGLRPGEPEPSPKVRAAAVIAWCARLRGPAEAATAWGALEEVLRRERDPLVLRIACEQLSHEVEGRSEPNLPPSIVAAVEALASRSELPGKVVEAAATTAEVLRRVTDPVRRAWTDHLRARLADVPVGGRCRVEIDPRPEGLPPLPDDPAWLGAVLADLSARDFGVYAERRGGTLRLWRGDRFGRRLWRVWHELRRPAPNKRQAFRHTIGRRLSGALRAHPARLDEATATVVPGERVHVGSEGGWGRHLPTVDDLLDLPLGGRAIQLFSSHGVTTVSPPESIRQRLRNRLRLTAEYERWARLRLGSLQGREPRERRRYIEQLRRELGISIAFTPYERRVAPERVNSLLSAGSAPLCLALVEPGLLEQLGETLADRQEYWLSPGGNGIIALAVFTALLFTVFLVDAWRSRRAIAAARKALPLCVGGWGTRGKSGSERLKAALFGGLGFEVFAKTTGSEAMFVHTAPGGTPSEFFIYRPYDKATIWEQRDMVELGRRLGTEVFVWECMALQPNFVELLQNDWMRDDLATLTNAYPDHEDIQGPAGVNVAEVISQFVPRGGTVVTSEDHFLPLLEEVARERGTKLVHSPAWQAELIPDELLALFPYREHPRNVALIATMAEQLGVSRTRAIALMAEHVQPEIGVLKVFGPARVRGRNLTFFNGHSANERTGFVNNWRRMGLDAVDVEEAPHRAVITVINNRWDRVARSEVFARILVEDASADRHVLIGTNLDGLMKYVRGAIDRHLARRELVSDEDLRGGEEGLAAIRERLARELAWLKVPRPGADAFFERVRRCARGAGLAFVPSPSLSAIIEDAFAADDETLDVRHLRRGLTERVSAPLLESLVADADPVSEQPEVIGPATAEDVREHSLYLLARMVVHARLRRLIPRPGADSEQLEDFHEAFREAWRALFLEQFVPVHDPQATGDQIVDACARCVPPGSEVSVMGAQNIKGTGLDWVYRWIALDRVQRALRTLHAPEPELRRQALDELEAFEDHGLIDTGFARAELPRLIHGCTDVAERDRLVRIHARVTAVHRHRLASLDRTGREGSAAERWVARLESGFDYLDSVRRRRLSDRLIADLIAGRVSHPRAALETRRLYERQKGGWLVPALQRWARVFGWRPAPTPTEVADVPLELPLPTSARAAPTRGAQSVVTGGDRFDEALRASRPRTVTVPDALRGNTVSTAAPPERTDDVERGEDTEPTANADPVAEDDPRST